MITLILQNSALIKVHEATMQLSIAPEIVCYKNVLYTRIGLLNSRATYREAGVYQL